MVAVNLADDVCVHRVGGDDAIGLGLLDDSLEGVLEVAEGEQVAFQLLGTVKH